jgi:hypothetical protein
LFFLGVKHFNSGAVYTSSVASKVNGKFDNPKAGLVKEVDTDDTLNNTGNDARGAFDKTIVIIKVRAGNKKVSKK